MKRLSGCKAFAATVFAGWLAAVPLARADSSARVPERDSAPDEIKQVLVIPQQCNEDAIAALCDRSGAALNPGAARGFPADGASTGSGSSESNLLGVPDDASPASSSNATDIAYGSIDDYERQFQPSEPATVVPYVPMPVFVPVFVTPAYSFGAPLPPSAAFHPRFSRPRGGHRGGRR